MPHRYPAPTITHIVLILAVTATSACSPAEDHWFREVTDPDGVRAVENGPIPRDWERNLPVLSLTDEAVIGAGRKGEAYMLSFRPTGRWVAKTPDGRIGYAEHQPTELRVYHPDGRLALRAGREGNGPGEFQRPIETGFVPGVGWILKDSGQDRLVVFDDEGSHQATRSLSMTERAQSIRRSCYGPAGDFWFLGVRTRPRDGGQYTTFYVMWTAWEDLKSAQVDTFLQPMLTPSSGNDMHYHDRLPVNLVVDGEGRAWVNGKLPYQIEVYEPGGEGRWRIRRQHDPVDYPDSFREYHESMTMAEMPEGKWYIKLPPVQPAIAGMNWTDDDEMWVFTSAYVDSPLVQVDVFSPDGEYLRAFLADRRLREMPIGSGYLYRSDFAEDGSPLLIRSRYSLVPRR